MWVCDACQGLKRAACCGRDTCERSTARFSRLEDLWEHMKKSHPRDVRFQEIVDKHEAEVTLPGDMVTLLKYVYIVLGRKEEVVEMPRNKGVFSERTRYYVLFCDHITWEDRWWP